MEETDYVDICNFIQSDPNKRRWPSTLDKKNKRNFRQKCSKYEFISGTVHYKHPKRGNLRVIRESEKETILHACHKAPTAGHFGVVKTTKTITERYYWPRISKDIQDYIGKFTEFLTKIRYCNMLTNSPTSWSLPHFPLTPT